MYLTFAKANEESDKTISAILDKMSNEDREKNRKSYYGSLSNLFCHIAGGTYYFLTMFKESMKGNPAAFKALEALDKISIPEGKKFDEAGWKKISEAVKAADKVYVNFAAALCEKDLSAPVKVNWYKGKPETVPLSFMLGQLIAHGIHHRGQISQILDSLNIDNDYSGINVKFLK